MLNFLNIGLTEYAFVAAMVLFLRYVKMPATMRKRTLIKGFPWGYYEGSTPTPEGEFYAENNDSFLHNTGTRFEGLPGMGLLGEYNAHGFAQGYNDW